MTTQLSAARRAEIEKMEADIRKLTRPQGDSDSEDEGKKKEKGPSLLEAQLSKYTQGKAQSKKGAKRGNTASIVAQLNSFRGLIKAAGPSSSLNPVESSASLGDEDVLRKAEGDEGIGSPYHFYGYCNSPTGMEVDNDSDWLSHALSFPKGNEEEVAKAEREYEVIDPRARATRAREEEKERKAREQQGKKRKRW
jgi:peptidyl-prolyl cis-trans isomerase SDCCAG10